MRLEPDMSASLEVLWHVIFLENDIKKVYLGPEMAGCHIHYMIINYFHVATRLSAGGKNV